jgi:hypothetical protein
MTSRRTQQQDVAFEAIILIISLVILGYTFLSFDSSPYTGAASTNGSATVSVTIISALADPVVNLIFPENDTTITNETTAFNATFTDGEQLQSTLFHLWNSTDSLVNTTNLTISGTEASVNLTVVLPYEDTFKWNYQVYDNDSNAVYNDTNFTFIFSVPVVDEEGEPAIITTTGGSGGGNQGSVGFTTSVSAFSFTATKGTSHTQSFRLRNTASISLQYTLSSNQPFVSFYLNSFSLRPGEEKVITVLFQDMIEDIQTALITISTLYSQHYIPVVVSMESADSDFFADLVVPPAFSTRPVGGDLFSSLTLTDLDGGEVELQYVIVNAASEILHEETDVVKVREKVTIDKTMTLPSTLLPGTYVYGVIVTYKGTIVTSHQFFTVEASSPIEPSFEQPAPPAPRGMVFLFILIVVLGLHLYFKRRGEKILTP